MVYLNQHFADEHDEKFWLHDSHKSYSILPESLSIKRENFLNNNYLLFKFDYHIEDKEFDHLPFQCYTKDGINIFSYIETPYIIAKIFVPITPFDSEEDVFDNVYRFLYDEVLNQQYSKLNINHLTFLVHSFDNYKDCILKEIKNQLKLH